LLIIPAIDIKGGKCVRLLQGRPEDETVFSDKPVAMAKHWQKEGAKFLHLIDLDGAFGGVPKNLPLIKRIVESIDIPVELGGGIRTLKDIEHVLDIGLNRVILGTIALKEPDFIESVCKDYSEKIAVGIDAKDGMVATDGWLRVSHKSAIEFAIEMQQRGVKTIIYTDIKRDGMLTGPNINTTKKIAQAVDIDVIASGGISSIDDILAVKSLEQFGVTGVIIGKALYTGKVSLQEAIAKSS